MCGCLAAFLCSSAGGEIFTDAALGQQDLFQINHCYVEVPGAGETVVTNDGSRLWLHGMRIRDTTGSMTVAVREKAALALSGCDSTASFQAAHRTNNPSYPILCGVRIHVSKRKAGDGGDPDPTAVRAVMVEAEDKDLTYSPNQSLLALGPVLKSLASSTEELKIARCRRMLAWWWVFANAK